MLRLTVTASALLIAISPLALAQTPAEFEVASVKMATPTPYMAKAMNKTGGPGTSDPSQLTYTNAPMQALLEDAFGVRKHQLSGPPWLNQSRFDVLAKLPPGATREQVRAMLQKLLVDRFGLTFHHESREVAVYVLVVAKGGVKMKVSSDNPPAVPERFPQLRQGQQSGMAAGMSSDFVIRYTARKQTLATLANILYNSMDRPVLDATELTGTYDFTLEYLPEHVSRASGVPSDSQPDPDTAPAPSVYSAVQSQLGLRLDSRKSPFDVIVIDELRKSPTEN